MEKVTNKTKVICNDGTEFSMPDFLPTIKALQQVRSEIMKLCDTCESNNKEAEVFKEVFFLLSEAITDKIENGIGKVFMENCKECMVKGEE